MAVHYLLHNLIRLRHLLYADLMLPHIIGEIGHRNISALSHLEAQGRRIDQLDHSLESERLPAETRYLPVNAYPLSMTMRVQDATMRRKVACLVERGFFVISRSGAPGCDSHCRAAATAQRPF